MRTIKREADEESVNGGLSMDDAHCRSKWSDGVNHISAGLR